ncbi:MAG: ABC transporter permease, partial [Ilumatobacteraceae bacterium]
MITQETRPAAEEPPVPLDERVSFRGPIQRLLVRPEIGALIGTTAVWIFFWALSDVFGTAAGTANYLDVAAILGIMAVAVSLLMIGGEFDLSSGSMTGATAMLVILLSKDVGEFGGAGLSLFIAVPLSFAFAMMIGWFNGTLVEKTRLPSFIVTLGTFFILIGAKLSFSKLFSGQVVVEGLNEADGYEFWSRIFAAAWVRNDHLWEDRDIAWTVLLIVGAACVVIGVLELSYRRARPGNAKGLIGAAIGIVVAGAGFYGLLNGEGVGRNALNSVILAVGVLVAVLGWAMWRFAPLGRRGAVTFDNGVGRLALLGLVAIVAGVVVALLLNPDSGSPVGLLISDGFSRALFAAGLGIAGLLAIFVAAGKLPVWAPLVGLAVSAIPAVGYLMTQQGARA